ncbi:hypothetical protein [Kibdelosporangium philippinense]
MAGHGVSPWPACATSAPQYPKWARRHELCGDDPFKDAVTSAVASAV